MLVSQIGIHFLCFYKISACRFRFIIKKDAPGLTATKIENKIGLRIVQNGDILMKNVFVADEDRLPGVDTFQDTNKVQYCEELCNVDHVPSSFVCFLLSVAFWLIIYKWIEFI